MSIKKKIPFTPAMPKLLIALVASVAAISLQGATPEQTRLLVAIMVDGLDTDYIDLLRDRLTDGGLRRLERDGVQLTADYGTPLDPTAATATIMTGAPPSTSGIGADSRFDRNSMRPVDVYADANTLGNFSASGFSPTALRVSNLSDELRIASGGTNMVYAVGLTPGISIGMAGHAANSAMWLDQKTGNWASSTAYQEMPVGIASRNRLQPLAMRLDTMSWTPSLSPDAYPALPDHLTRYPFRYVFPRGSVERLDMFTASPMFNREVTDVAAEVLRSQKLGTHEGVTDVLNIAYVLNPYPYGKSPDKRVETMDAYIKLDRNLDRLFADIDKGVGLDNTMIMLAATPPRPQRRRDDERWNIPYGEFSTRRAISLLNVYLMALHGNGEYVTAYHNGHIFLNHNFIKEQKLNIEDVRQEAAAFMAKMTGIDRVYTIDAILAGHAGQNPEALRRNTVASTAGDLIIEAAPGFEVIDDFNITDPSAAHTGMVRTVGTSTAPVFILAPGVAPRTITTPVDARAIAPGMARLLRIRSPNGAAVAPLSLR